MGEKPSIPNFNFVETEFVSCKANFLSLPLSPSTTVPSFPLTLFLASLSSESEVRRERKQRIRDFCSQFCLGFDFQLREILKRGSFRFPRNYRFTF